MKSTNSVKLCDVYRMTEVQRWHMVNTGRPQSVAEHSCMVALIATRIAEAYWGLCNNPNDNTHIRLEIYRYALEHDMPEVFTGDIPYVTKRALSASSQVNLNGLEDGVCSVGFRNEFAAMVVKAADLIEAMAYLDRSLVTTHTQQVRVGLDAALSQFLENKETEFREACENVLIELDPENQTFLDDY